MKNQRMKLKILKIKDMLFVVFLMLLVLDTSPALSEELCKGINTNPEYLSMIKIGFKYAKEKRYKEAIKKFKQAQVLCEFHPKTTYYIARAFHHMENCKVAYILYQKAKEQIKKNSIETNLTLDIIEGRIDEINSECIEQPEIKESEKIVRENEEILGSKQSNNPVVLPKKGGLEGIASAKSSEPNYTAMGLVGLGIIGISAGIAFTSNALEKQKKIKEIGDSNYNSAALSEVSYWFSYSIGATAMTTGIWMLIGDNKDDSTSYYMTPHGGGIYIRF